MKKVIYDVLFNILLNVTLFKYQLVKQHYKQFV